MYDFPVIATFEEAWQKVKGAKMPFFLVILSFVALILVTGIIAAIIHIFVNPSASIIVSIIADVFQLVLAWGIIYLGIQRAMGAPIFYSMIKNVFSFDLFGKMIGLYILYFTIVGLPLLFPLLGYLLVKYVGDTSAMQLIKALLSIIGSLITIYLAIRISLGKGIVVNERKNPIEAIKISFAATRGNFWNVLGFLLLQILVLVISIIPLGIGLIWSIPLCSIAYGLLYRKLVVLRTDLGV
jgi:uncharacterized membrane protein